MNWHQKSRCARAGFGIPRAVGGNSKLRGIALVLAAFLTAGTMAESHAGMITDADTIALVGDENITGSGNGTLAFMWYTKGVNENKQGGNGANWDDANTDVPTGDGNTDDGVYDEYFITSFGDLQEFYSLNFGVTGTGEITLVIFLDLDETEPFSPNNSLEILDLWLDPEAVAGEDPTVPTSDYDAAGGDVDDADQNVIADATEPFAGGELLAYLDPLFTNNLPVTQQGGGFADYALITMIDPFAYNPSQLLLVHQKISVLSNGPETKFLSGLVASNDLCTGTPLPPNCIDPDPTPMNEPSTLALLGTGILGLFVLVRRRRRM